MVQQKEREKEEDKWKIGKIAGFQRNAETT